MDIDAEDNLYVITRFRGSDYQSSMKLSIFDENGNKKLECPLPFHQAECMAITKDGKIVILNCEGRKILYIGNICMELNSFEIDKSFSLEKLYLAIVRIGFSDFNGTKIIVADRYTVNIYTEDGQLQRTITIFGFLKHAFIESVAINHVTKRILVQTCQSSGSGISLLSFSDSGELIDSFCLGSSKWFRSVALTSHPKGPVALVGLGKAALLQL